VTDLLRETLRRYNAEYLADLKEILEARGFTVDGMSPGILFHRKSAVYTSPDGVKTYPIGESYSFGANEAAVLYELIKGTDDQTDQTD